jgi:hypothetical protein
MCAHESDDARRRSWLERTLPTPAPKTVCYYEQVEVLPRYTFQLPEGSTQWCPRAWGLWVTQANAAHDRVPRMTACRA